MKGMLRGEHLSVALGEVALKEVEEERRELGRADMEGFDDDVEENERMVREVLGWVKARAHARHARLKGTRKTDAAHMQAACRVHNFVRIHRTDFARKSEEAIQHATHAVHRAHHPTA